MLTAESKPEQARWLPAPAGASWTQVPRTGTRPRARSSLRADVAIVGAGLAGLSTALHIKLASPGTEVVVLEAGTVGAGASGRGTGLLGPRVGPEIEVARQRYGDRVARAMYLTSEAAVRELLALVAEQEIACGLIRAPQFVLARSEHDARRLRARARAYEDLEIHVPFVSAPALHAVLGGIYRGGLRHDTAATLEPGLLSEGLAQCAERLGVTIYEESPVINVHPGQRPALSLAGSVSVRAESLVLTTNAYPLASAAHSRGTVPLEVHASATAPLPMATLRALGLQDGRAIIEDGALAPYFRCTPDRRLIFGGGGVTYPLGGPASRRTRAAEGVWQQQERWLRTLHPALRQVEVSHRWNGYVGLTRDNLPVVGASADALGRWQARGWCGHGLAMSVRAGRELAAAILGSALRDADLPWWRGAAPWLPSGGRFGLLLRGYLALLGRRVEQRLATQCEG